MSKLDKIYQFYLYIYPYREDKNYIIEIVHFITFYYLYIKCYKMKMPSSIRIWFSVKRREDMLLDYARYMFQVMWNSLQRNTLEYELFLILLSYNMHFSIYLVCVM